MAMRVQSAAEIRERMLARLVANTELSDLRETDPATQALYAAADELFRAQIEMWKVRDGAYLSTAEDDDDVDEHAAEVLPEGMERDEGSYATGGALVFTRPTGGAGGVTVVAGTPVQRSKDGYGYRTLGVATFGAGATESSGVSVVASTKGTDGNCAATEIDRLGVSIAGITGCRNTASITNGRGRQSNEDLKQAIRDHVAGIVPPTPAGILRTALAVDDATYGRCLFAKLGTVRKETAGYVYLYIDDGNGTSGPQVAVGAGEVLVSSSQGGERIFFLARRPLVSAGPVLTDELAAVVTPSWVLPWGMAEFSTGLAVAKTITAAAYTVYGGLVAAVQAALDGDVMNPLTTSGAVGAGCLVVVKPAALKTGGYVSITATVDRINGVSLATVSAVLKRQIVQFVNSLDIGAPLLVSDIVTLLRANSYVTNVRDVTINGVALDLYCAASEIIRTKDTEIDLS